MKQTFIAAIASKFTIVLLLCSGWASGQGIASALNIDAMGFTVFEMAAFAGFTVLGFGVSITALHLLGSWQDNANPLDLAFALMLSSTTVLGFLTHSVGNIEKSKIAKSALEIAQDHYYGLQASYNQLRMAKRLRERQELEPKLQKAKAEYMALIDDKGHAAASLTAYHDIARALGFTDKGTSWFILFFFGIAIEGSMARSHLSTRRKVSILDTSTRAPVKRAPVDRPLTKKPSIALDKNKVDEIVNLWRSGLTSQSEIARRLNVSRQYVNQVLREEI